MGEKIWRWTTTQENHGNQKEQGTFHGSEERDLGSKLLQKSSGRWGQKCGCEANQPTDAEQDSTGGGKSWALRPDRCPFKFWFSHLQAPFPHLQIGDDNGSYLSEFLLVLNGKSPFSVCSTHQGIKKVWFPITNHTEGSRSCWVTIRRVLV